MSRETQYLSKRKQTYRDKVDTLELVMTENFPLVECEWMHEFTPGMYIRTIKMKAGTMVSSRVHKTEHPYVISSGAVSVKIKEGVWELLEAGHRGITKPGTHRILFIHYDTVWTTFHVNPDDCRDIATIEERILEKYENPLLKNLNAEPCLT